MSQLVDLAPLGANGELHVVVECPRGATVKLKYEPRLRTMAVSRSLPLGLSYPFDWGFVPGTTAPDGDPLDALALHDASTYPGVVLRCRPIGVVQLEQEANRGGRERNDRIIAIPSWHDRMGELARATELPERLRLEIEQFFLSTTFFTAKNPVILGWKNSRAAKLLVQASVKNYRSRRKKSRA
jgi:inorganic pyrophosphatase